MHEMIMSLCKWWILPDGKAIYIVQNHIDTVLSNYKLFGYGSWTELRDRFRKYGEKIGLEANARREILTELMGKGFIRVRREPVKLYYSFNTDIITDEKIKRISAFLDNVKSGYSFPVYSGNEVESEREFREVEQNIQVVIRRFDGGEVLKNTDMKALIDQLKKR